MKTRNLNTKLIRYKCYEFELDGVYLCTKFTKFMVFFYTKAMKLCVLWHFPSFCQFKKLAFKVHRKLVIETVFLEFDITKEYENHCSVFNSLNDGIMLFAVLYKQKQMCLVLKMLWLLAWRGFLGQNMGPPSFHSTWYV